MIRLCVLDMAGTTVHDDGAVERAFEAALADAGLDLMGADADHRREFVRRTMGMSKIEVFREILGDERAARRANLAFERAYGEEVADGRVGPVSGAAPTLVRLREAGFQTCLTTGFSDDTRRAILDALGWNDLVDLSLSPGPGLRGRPAPDMVLHALMRLGIDDVRQAAVVGDTANDLLSGWRAGASVVAGVLTGAHTRAQLATAPHTHVIETIAELPGVLDA